MIKNLSEADKTEAHTKSKESTGAGNVGNSAHFFRFPESLGVGLLDENIDDCQVTLCIVVYFSFNRQGQSLVRNPFSPPSSTAQLDSNDQWKKSLGTLGGPDRARKKIFNIFKIFKNLLSCSVGSPSVPSDFSH